MIHAQNGWPLEACVFALFEGPNLLTLRELMLQTIAQKIIVCSSVLNLG